MNARRHNERWLRDVTAMVVAMLAAAAVLLGFSASAQGAPPEGGVSAVDPTAFPDGSESAPSITNLGDTNTGAWFCAADAVCISTGGTERFRLTTTTLTLTLPIRGANGSAVAPTYSFTNDTDAGMYLAAVGLLGISVGTVTALNISNALLLANVPVEVPNGSGGAASLRFTSGAGLYSGGFVAGDLSIVGGGGTRFGFTSDAIRFAANNAQDLGTSLVRARTLYVGTSISADSTDSTGTPGAATINKMSGKSAIAAGASSAVITNSTVAATSRVFVQPTEADATCHSGNWIALAAAGSFTVTALDGAGAAVTCTTATNFDWLVIQ